MERAGFVERHCHAGIHAHPFFVQNNRTATERLVLVDHDN